MKTYESKKDGIIVSFIKEEDGRVFLKRDDAQFDVSSSTFKRWYKETNAKETVTEKSPVAVLEKPDVEENIAVISPAPKEKKEVIETPKQLKKAVETKVTKAQKATRNEEAEQANTTLVTSLLQYGQKKGCDIIAHNVDTVLRLGTRNIVKTVIGKTTATMFFNFQSIPVQYFDKNKLECVPAEWKWALEVKVKVSEANQKVILDLIDFGVNFVMDRALAKEKMIQDKAEKKATKKAKSSK